MNMPFGSLRETGHGHLKRKNTMNKNASHSLFGNIGNTRNNPSSRICNRQVREHPYDATITNNNVY